MALTNLTKPRARWTTFKLKLAQAVSRSLYDKLVDGGVSPKDFGAKGDGVTDDTLAVTYALNSGAPLTSNSGDTYLLSSKILVPAGTRFRGNGCKFVSSYDFNDDNLFESTSADIEFYDCTFDGEHLPTLGSVFDGTQTAKGCLWVIDPDPTEVTTGGGTKSLLSHAKFIGCSFLNQPSSWIYSVNLSNVDIINCLFKTKADESTSSMMGIVGFGNNNTLLEMMSWNISNNRFVSDIDSSGDGNVKVLSINGGNGIVIQGNNYKRVVNGVEGVAGLHTSVFIKKSKGVVIDGNTSHHPGLFVKLEEDAESVVISNNVINEIMEIGIVSQGGKDSVITGNTFKDTVSYAMLIDGHSPSSSNTSGVLVKGNKISGVGSMNEDVGQSGFNRSAIVTRAISGLTTDDIVIKGNNIVGSTELDAHKKTYTAILALGSSGVTNRLSIDGNDISGTFSDSCIRWEAEILDLSLVGNTFSNLTVSYVIKDNAPSPVTVTDLLVQGNIVKACNSVAIFMNLTSCYYRGSLTVTGNTIQHDLSAYTVYISNSSLGTFTTLDTFIVDSNVFNEQASTTCYFGANCTAKIISFSNNVIENDGDNSYIVNVVGDDTTQVFEVCRIQNNTTQGRCNIRIGVNNNTTGTLIIDGNTSDYTGGNTGIIFTDSTGLNGYIGLNRIKGTTPTDSINGTNPATDLLVWADLIV